MTMDIDLESILSVSESMEEESDVDVYVNDRRPLEKKTERKTTCRLILISPWL